MMEDVVTLQLSGLSSRVCVSLQVTTFSVVCCVMGDEVAEGMKPACV